jgi:hypothetical protein
MPIDCHWYNVHETIVAFEFMEKFDSKLIMTNIDLANFALSEP